MNLWIYLIVLAICALVLRRIYQKPSSLTRREPPGPPRLPVFGNLFSLMNRTLKGEAPIVTFASWAFQYGPLYSVKFGSQKVVVVADAKLAQQLCNFHADKFSKRPSGLLLARILKDKGIVFNDGSSWKEHRTFLLQEFRKFGFGRQSVENRIQDVCTELLKQLEKSEGELHDPHLDLATTTYNIIWAVVGGETFQWDDKFLRSIIHNLETNLKVVELVGVQNYVTLFTFCFLLWNNPVHLLYIVSKRFYYFWTLIRRNKENDQRECLISDYLSQIERTCDEKETKTTAFSNFQLLFFVSDLFIAGGETTITTLRWSVLMLAAFPEMQEKIRKQIFASFGTEKVISYADRSEVPYLEAFIQEILRFSGVVPVMWRNTSSDCEFHDYLIEKDTWILLHFWAMGHQPSVWENPEEFRPERFLLPDGSFRKNENLLAFSTGKRQCPGESLARFELFILLGGILQKFQIKLPDERTPDLTGRFGVTCCPPEYKVTFTKIK